MCCYFFIFCRILATRIADLEKRLEYGTDANEGVAVFPSKILLESYTSSDVDRFKFDEVYEESIDADESNIDENVVEKQNEEDADEKLEVMCNNIDNVSLKEDEDDDLPPELQKLVQEALDNLCSEQK